MIRDIKLNIEYIKILLKRDNVTAKEVCYEMEIPTATLNCVLLGQTKNPSFLLIVKLMRYFGIEDAEELIIDV